MLKLESLTPAQRAVLVLSVLTLLVGFWLTGSHRSSGREGDAEMTAYEAPSEQPVSVVVHVVGEVQRPGVYRLPAESRVRDAVRAAGGFTPNARAESVNLAAYCEDGEQINVQAQEVASGHSPPPLPPPTPSLTSEQPAEIAVSAQPPAPPAQTGAPPQRPETGDSEAASASTLPDFALQPPRPQVRINHADLDELQQIPGVGPELAQRIIYHRHTHGPFRSRADLQKVSGIGAQTVERILLSATLN